MGHLQPKLTGPTPLSAVADVTKSVLFALFAPAELPPCTNKNKVTFKKFSASFRFVVRRVSGLFKTKLERDEQTLCMDSWVRARAWSCSARMHDLNAPCERASCTCTLHAFTSCPRALRNVGADSVHFDGLWNRGYSHVNPRNCLSGLMHMHPSHGSMLHFAFSAPLGRPLSPDVTHAGFRTSRSPRPRPRYPAHSPRDECGLGRTGAAAAWAIRGGADHFGWSAYPRKACFAPVQGTLFRPFTLFVD